MKNLIISICCISFSFTQVFSSYDYVGARATSMSGSVTSGPEGTWSIFHNPAQLSNLKGVYVSNGYSQIFGLEFPVHNQQQVLHRVLQVQQGLEVVVQLVRGSHQN